ncbi:hypothetical protein Fmac_007812 [Flemingia macrophylla]|uniref:Uncharacterized protein n=1 Tax=Flemingia macrophylla TaxID=520843 RepID=A0ABD1MWG1_9FABA
MSYGGGLRRDGDWLEGGGDEGVREGEADSDFGAQREVEQITLILFLCVKRLDLKGEKASLQGGGAWVFRSSRNSIRSSSLFENTVRMKALIVLSSEVEGFALIDVTSGIFSNFVEELHPHIFDFEIDKEIASHFPNWFKEYADPRVKGRGRGGGRGVLS